MNYRDSLLETLSFGNPQRIPFQPGAGRESTQARWHKEGLPAEIDNTDDITAYAYKQAGGELELYTDGQGFPISYIMIPQFEEKVIAERERSLIVQDWKGNICEIGKEFDVTYLSTARDFVTRSWLKCPVANWDQWERMKKRYVASDQERLPAHAAQLGQELKNREHVIEWGFSGPYWQMREWLGFEELSMMFHDDPALIKDMVEFWTDYVADLLENAFRYVTPDIVHISEDMAYKGFSMLSPAMCKEFLAPCWKKWGEVIRAAGVPIYAVDSDGFIGELIPLWIECSVNACDPIEVAAGNDINQFRKQFGKNMAYRGGVDKRCIAAGGEAIEKEIKRITPVIEDGGFIPGCDHGVPHDISWQDFVYYVKLLAERTGWK